MKQYKNAELIMACTQGSSLNDCDFTESFDESMEL